MRHKKEAPFTLRVLRAEEVAVKIGVSKAKLYDMIAKGEFFKPFKLTPDGRAAGYLESDVDAWILERKRLSEREV